MSISTRDKRETDLCTLDSLAHLELPNECGRLSPFTVAGAVPEFHWLPDYLATNTSQAPQKVD